MDLDVAAFRLQVTVPVATSSSQLPSFAITWASSIARCASTRGVTSVTSTKNPRTSPSLTSGT